MGESVDAREASNVCKHVGIIMDGNGRWAAARGLPRTSGHLEGLKTARRIVEAASRLGLSYLTLYVFSTENWKRAQSEVDFIMGLVKAHLVREMDFYRENGIRIRHAGDETALSDEIRAELRKARDQTKDFTGLQVVLALNYGGRDEIVRAVKRAAEAGVRGDRLDEKTFASFLDNPDIPDPDLIVRTSGDLRSSNFLLWEAAYAEFVFSPTFWPDWTEDDLRAALADFGKRDRRYGDAEREKGACSKTSRDASLRCDSGALRGVCPPLKGVADDQTEGGVDAPLGADISTGERAVARGKTFPL
jgi:undecaprenyl diphosphate synthase